MLVVGNFINTGGYAGNAAGFKLSLLTKVHEIKSNKPRMTMMHVLVESIEKNKPELLHFYKKFENITQIAKWVARSFWPRFIPAASIVQIYDDYKDNRQ